MTVKMTILGCGNSSGVPAIGNYWGECDPNEPKNKRNRCCLLVQSKKTNIIIDTGADIRHQINSININKVDAIFYTHYHNDHTHGIDDFRAFYFRNGRNCIDCYGSKETFDVITSRFSYLFAGGNNEHLYPPILKSNIFDEGAYGSKMLCSDIQYIPFKMDHGTCEAVGYRFGDVSYCVDMKSLDQDALDAIKGSRVWIVDGAGYKNPDNIAHACLERLYEYNRYIGADKVYVTCLSSQMDYKRLCEELPQGFYPAYDGLVI